MGLTSYKSFTYVFYNVKDFGIVLRPTSLV